MTMPTYFPMTNNMDTYTNNLRNQRTGLEKLVNFKNNYGNTAAYEDFSDLMQEYTYNPNQTPLWEGTQNMLHTYINKGNDYVQAYGDTSRFTPTALNHKKIDLRTLGTNNTNNNNNINTNNNTAPASSTPNIGTNNNNQIKDPLPNTLLEDFHNKRKYIALNGNAEQRTQLHQLGDYSPENYETVLDMYNDAKPGFFGNIWNNILEAPGAFTKSALSIWNGYNAYKANKDYMNLARESFDLQKQQYLDREERTKKEFAALQSRRAGSSL